MIFLELKRLCDVGYLMRFEKISSGGTLEVVSDVEDPLYSLLLPYWHDDRCDQKSTFKMHISF